MGDRAVRRQRQDDQRATTRRTALGSQDDSCGSCTATLPQVPTTPQRRWTDSTNVYKVQAKFDGLSNGKVRLRQADGKIIELPLEKLSAADAEYAKRSQAASDDYPRKLAAYEAAAAALKRGEAMPGGAAAAAVAAKPIVKSPLVGQWRLLEMLGSIYPCKVLEVDAAGDIANVEFIYDDGKVTTKRAWILGKQIRPIRPVDAAGSTNTAAGEPAGK